MNIYDVIKAEHQEIHFIITRMLKGSEGGRLQQLDALQRLAVHHLKAESDIFFKNLASPQQRKPGLGDSSSEAIRKALDDLNHDINAADFHDRLIKLDSLIEKHAISVEGEDFVTAKQALSQEDANVLGQRFESQRRQDIGDGKPLSKLAKGEFGLETEDPPSLQQSLPD